VDPLESQRSNNSSKISSTVKSQTEELTQMKPLLMVPQFKVVFLEENNQRKLRIFFLLMLPLLPLVLRLLEEL